MLNVYRIKAGPSDLDILRTNDLNTTTKSFQPFKVKADWRSYFPFFDNEHAEQFEEEEKLDEEALAPAPRRANAAIVMLARNTDLEGVVSSMRQLEDRFNNKFNYPWIFLNDKEFTDEFKKYGHCILQKSDMI